MKSILLLVHIAKLLEIMFTFQKLKLCLGGVPLQINTHALYIHKQILYIPHAYLKYLFFVASPI
ncbi:hypothetical protein PROVALCAL_01407 [Providencia alcalifaciens DSM 30120]|uniref:Uncharacterized protein n=1 Tax=Providencia alcalifaciens DSM 30120 TaxID=520999 RepID=B6XDI5_9GAMM|nr:hypothetical protein PROVALCAL_01407 [Providencia alcalifaciens DSM 30120]